MAADLKKVVSIADKSGDSRMWSAEQMLEELLSDVRSGKLKPDKMIVLFWEPKDGGKSSTRYSRYVNFTKAEQVAFLARAAHDALHDWKESSSS